MISLDNSNNNFGIQFARGQIAEGEIAQWVCRSKGGTVLPVYEKETPTGKGPRLFLPDKQLIAPDMFVITSHGAKWIEAKSKAHFTWYRKTKQWQTGIDLRHYLDYLEVAERTPFPIWLLFLHRNPTPSIDDLNHGSPAKCPTGLFRLISDEMKQAEDHRDRYEKNGRGFPMVYWNHKNLTRLATIREFDTAITTNDAKHCA